jgi:hypothetical protein
VGQGVHDLALPIWSPSTERHGQPNFKILPAKSVIPSDVRNPIIRMTDFIIQFPIISPLIISYLFREFTMKCWESKHSMRIPTTTVNLLISQKLLTEHSCVVKKALNNDESVDEVE